MENIYGNNPVSGENFFGREKVVKLLVGILLSKNSFLLLGLRRIGKSSTIAESVRQIRELQKDVVLIELNCQTYKNIQDFYKELNLALPLSWREKLKKWLKEGKRIPTKIIDYVTDHVEEVDIPVLGTLKFRNDIISYANPLREEITKFFKAQNEHIILCIDELPFLFENISKSDNPAYVLEIESILTTLRDWRNIGISQAICGSINLHLQLDQLGISKKLLAGLNSQQLPNYSAEEAAGLLEALSNSKNANLTKEDIEEMLQHIPDFIPQFLQYYFFIVKTYYEGKTGEIKDLYEEHVYPLIVKDFEYQFEERFSKLDKKQRSFAKIILDAVNAKDKLYESELLKKMKKEDGYQVLIQLLEYEFLVRDNEQRYSFSFTLLKNWWNKINQ